MVHIYVMPTEQGIPPRAIIGEPTEEGIQGPMATWSRDSGSWQIEGMPVPEDLSEAITDHARELGVEEFLNG